MLGSISLLFSVALDDISLFFQTSNMILSVFDFQVLPSAAISYFVYEFMKIVLKVESQ